MASVLFSHLLALMKPPNILELLCGEAQLGQPLRKNGDPQSNS